MNYIKELNAFKNWILLCELPTSAIVLWHTLMTINNGTYWKREFNAPNAVVRQLSGLSKQRLLDARVCLIEHGRIRCQNGKKGQAPIYEMIPFEPFVDSSVDPLTASSADAFKGQSNAQTVPIHKQKQKTKTKQDSSRTREADDPISLYENNIGKLRPHAADLLQAWIVERGETLVMAAIERAVKRGGRSFSYVETILKEWAKAGIVSLEDMYAFEEAKRSARANTVSLGRGQPEDKTAFFEALRQEGTVS